MLKHKLVHNQVDILPGLQEQEEELHRDLADNMVSKAAGYILVVAGSDDNSDDSGHIAVNNLVKSKMM